MMRTTLLLLATSLLVLGIEAQRFSNFANFGQACAPFTCRSSQQVAVPKRDFVYTANGCGTAQLPISTDVDFSDCCNWHDACYSTCGMKKSTCEKRLDKCMKATCAALTDTDARSKCQSTAQLFAIGAQMIACPAYQDAQRAACTCVAPHRAAVATRARLEHVLATSGASDDAQLPEAVDALLAKYAGQEPLMFLRLLLKYPHALQIDALKRNFMDDIFKGSSGVDAPVVDERVDESVDESVDEHIEL